MGANNHLTVVPANYNDSDDETTELTADGGREPGVVGYEPHLTVLPETDGETECDGQ